MKQRIVTGFFIALVYVGVVLGTIYVSPVFLDALVVFLMLTAGYEMMRCIENKYSPLVKPAYYISVLSSYLIFKVAHYFFGVNNALFVSVIFVLLFAALTIVYTMFNKKFDVKCGALTALCEIYPAGLLLFFLSVGYINSNFYAGAVVLVFLSTSFADVAAYFVGSMLKGPKFCPEISPKKTVSGAIGGLIGGLLSGLIIFLLGYFNLLNISLLCDNVWFSLMHSLILGLGSAIFCECGDLLASFVKRICEVKDYGNVLAGHGGIMDRIDGLIISSIFIFAYYYLLGLAFAL